MFEDIKYAGCGKFISRGEWIHPDRIINSHEIIFVTSGTVFINENGIDYALKENDLLLLEPNLRHFGYKESTDTSFYWLHYVGSTEAELTKQMHIESPYNLSILCKQLIHYSTDNKFPECLDYLIRLILAEISSSKIILTENKLVNRASQWVKANNDIIIKVSDVADYLGYNTDYISRLFKKHYGINLKEYIDRTKIQFVKNQLLNTNFSLREISFNSGFDEYKYFIKFFKQHEKLTPTEFRSAYSKTHINHK